MASTQVEETVTSSTNLKAVQIGARLVMFNEEPITMSFLKPITWSGNAVVPGFPSTIRPNDTASFSHQGGANTGSIAAVIYTSSNQNGQPCAWILAWNAPSNYKPSSPNKVYVGCGSKSRIEAMKDAEILSHLNNASSSADAIDENSKTYASASITYSSQILSAVVSANFGLLP